jgi:hypothetical protein
MKKDFIEKVLRERIVDTKQYRYVAKVKDGKQYINRLPVADLDTTSAIDGWKTVWSEDEPRLYKIYVGNCGPEAILSNVIKATDKKDALRKYCDSIGEPYDDEKLNNELRYVIEQKPKKMKQYRIKDDRRESWGDGWESVVTEDEVRRLANEWGVSFDDLLDDLEEI